VAETDAHDGTASMSKRLVHTHAGVQHAAKIRGAAHEQPRDALGGASRTQNRQPSLPIGGGGETAGRGLDAGCWHPQTCVIGTGQGPTGRAQAEDHAKASWRRRARAMGGGSTANFRCRRILRITSPCVMAVMIRNDPR